ncbi:MAG: hypothetical protein MJ151_02095, partial [Lachnospiraceae bacterium]|nr:hypothetical protein [Lachnospiraceae bacterium]
MGVEEEREKTKETIQNICRTRSDEKHISKCEYKGINSFESSAILYKIRIFCEPRYRAEIKYSVNNAIIKGLDEAD